VLTVLAAARRGADCAASIGAVVAGALFRGAVVLEEELRAEVVRDGPSPPTAAPAAASAGSESGTAPF
jgi:hypothetical protein